MIKDALDLNLAMSELAKLRSIFHSEADFQFALAILLHEMWPEFEVRLEIPQPNRITLDMLVMDASNEDRFAIELKYKTALWRGVVAGEAFNLKNHGADVLGGYDIVKDIGRIESLIAGGSANSGAVIALTNEPLYSKPRPAKTKLTNAHEFRVHEGLILSGTRSWGPNTGGSNKNRTDNIEIAGAYPCDWDDYSNVGGSRGSFRQLVLKVNH